MEGQPDLPPRKGFFSKVRLVPLFHLKVFFKILKVATNETSTMH